MHNQFVKFIIGTLLGLAVALLISFNVLLLWVATGPRSLNALSPFIESAFEPADQSYSVVIGETWLIWDGWKHPVDIRLRHVVVMKAGQRFSTFPEISLGVDVLSLPRILPTSLTITHPIFKLFQNEDRSISLGLRKDESTADILPPAADDISAVPFTAVMATLLAHDDSSPLRKLRLITIKDADINVGNTHKDLIFTATNTNLVFRRDRHGNIEAQGGAKISYDSYQSMINAQLNLHQNSSIIDGEIAFSELMPGVLASLFSDNKLLAAFQLPISGNGKLAVDKDGTLQRLDFIVEGGKGTINSDRLDGGVLPVDALHVAGQLSNNASEIIIKTFDANLDGMLFSADGNVSLSNGDAAIQGNVNLKNVPAANVHVLWPPELSPQSRQWITANISEGTVTQAQAHVNIAPGDLGKPVLPKEDIDAAITLEGAKIRYLPEHPEVSDVKGVIHVNAESLEADIASAHYMKDTTLSSGKLLIADLNADNPYIKIGFDAESSAKDMVKFLGLPRLKHAQRLNLKEDSAAGTAKGHAELGFYFFAPHDAKGRAISEPDVAYDVSAELKGVSQPGFMNKFDIADADGNLTVKNSGIEFKGGGTVNGASVSSSDVTYLFKPDKGFDTLIDVTASLPVEALPRFGYPAFPFLKGTLGVKANVKLGDNMEQSKATIDLTNASVAVTDFGWIKPDKEPATLELSAEKKEGTVRIPSFHITGKGSDASGSAALDKDLSGFQQLSFDRLRYGNTDLDRVFYESIEGGIKLEAQGKSADMTAWLEKDGKSSGTFSFEHFPAVQFKGDMGRVILGKDRELLSVKGDMTCDVRMCSGANIAGTTVDNKPFAFRILRNPKGQRQMSLHAEDAGAFLKAADVFDGMEGGDLTITGNYDDSGAASVLKGRIDINEHVIKNAPILAKILSLTSLTGIFDTLQGNGIAFSKLSALFTLSKDVITIEKGKTHGDAIGITADGTITFPKRALDLQGTIIPSYTLNNVLGKVPLVGTALTGGEGQGVFAARYSVKGLTKEPDVSVNPLSILTPGFLRGVFDIFDLPDRKKDDAE